jgi:type I restriction enzyme, S subunit
MSLPRGWAAARLDDVVVERVLQGPPSTHAVPYIDISAIDRERKRIGETETVTGSTAPTRARQRVKAGDVLVSMTRPNLNAVALVPDSLDGAVASTGFDVLRAVGVLPEWLYYRVRTHDFVQDVCRGVQGVVYPAIRPADVRRHKLPVAPRAEQTRIVEALEAHLSRLDAAVASLESAQSKLKAYRASVLKAAVEGRLVPTEAALARNEGRSYEPADVLLERILKERRRRWEEAELAKLKSVGKTTKDDGWKAKYEEPKSLDTRNLPELPEGWCWATADAVGEILLGRRRAPEYMGTARPYLRVANVRDDHLDLSDVKEMPFDDRHGQKYLLHPGDILVSEGQSPELVGQSAIYRGGVDGLCFQATLHRFRALPGGPTPEFSQIVFRAHLRTGVFRTVASITTNIAHLTLEKFQESRFPLPPTAEQERIVLEIESRLSVADAIQKQMSTELSRIARLRQAILKWGFEGKLVDQDPNDELAETLLARVRAERAAVPAKKANSRRRGAA